MDGQGDDGGDLGIQSESGSGMDILDGSGAGGLGDGSGLKVRLGKEGQIDHVECARLDVSGGLDFAKRDIEMKRVVAKMKRGEVSDDNDVVRERVLFPGVENDFRADAMRVAHGDCEWGQVRFIEF